MRTMRLVRGNSTIGSLVVGALLGLLLTLLVATSEIGPREAARKQSPESAAATARGYAEAAHALSVALAASDDAFDQAWSDGNADWDRIGAAAAESAAIIDAAQSDFSADRAVLQSGPEEAELVRFADLFQKAAAATRACVGIVQQSVAVQSFDIYYASFPCFTASNRALAEARANLNELLSMLGVPFEI